MDGGEKNKLLNNRQLDEKKKQEEKLKILAEADKVKGEQFQITAFGINVENEIKKLTQGLEDDPMKKYDVYYKGIRRLLRKGLVGGKENEKARKYIYEEINTFLTRGRRIRKDGTRGADSRMAYIPDHEELLNVVIQWVLGNGTMAELFNTLHELNISKGYGKAF
jgi:hypothetical protein